MIHVEQVSAIKEQLHIVNDREQLENEDYPDIFPVEIHTPTKAILVPHCLYLPSFIPGIVDTQTSAGKESKVVSNLVSRLNCVVTVIHFRQASFDIALADIRAALLWAVRAGRRYGGDKNKIFFSATGFSASLAAAVALHEASNDFVRFPEAANRPGRIKGLVFYSPILRRPREWTAKDYKPGIDFDPSLSKALESFDQGEQAALLFSPLSARESDFARLQGTPSAVFTSAADVFTGQAERWREAMEGVHVNCFFKQYENGGFCSVLEDQSAFYERDQIDLVEEMLWDSVYHPLLE